jgi:uncharacterized protein YbbC (DUF1343 family)
MILGGGAVDAQRILSPLSVARMTAPATPFGEQNIRGLGWDIDSRYSGNRGELFPLGSFGHTGFTGPSIWIDPASDTYVVFLASRLHPDGKGDVTSLRAAVATVAASALTGVNVERAAARGWSRGESGPLGPQASRPETNAPVLTGLDVLAADGFAFLRGKTVGLVTNQAGVNRRMESAIDLIAQAKDVRLAALFSPEHGIRGTLDDKVPSSRDERTGLPIHSLYSSTKRPTSEMLAGLTTIVIDLQDIGARFYTYVSTMAYVMEEAARHRIPVVVLDRPNPIGGFDVEGPALDKESIGFTGYFSMPIRHGLTIGELARLFNDRNAIGADLSVIPMSNWRRDRWFDETGLPWINPSPNMRSLTQATLYPGIGAFEGTNISVGRGTDAPFEQIGAPWIDGVKLAGELNGRRLAGLRFYPTVFTPESSKFAGEKCQGVHMLVTDRSVLRPVRVGVELAAALVRLHGSVFQVESAAALFGSRALLARLKAGEDPGALAETWARDEAQWRRTRAQYLLYP